MSSKAVAWAWEQKVKPASSKLLLMAMADFCNPETNLCFPSVAALVEMTGLDRKTVLDGIARLKSMEVLRDTGRRTGRTQQIIVYRMMFPVVSLSVPKTGQLETVPISDGKSPVFPTKESRKRDTEPSIEPSKEEESIHSREFADRNLFGEPVKTPEQLAAELKAETIEFIEAGWKNLSEEIPAIAPIRGGKLDDARAEAALQRAEKFAKPDETAQGVWRDIFTHIRTSHWLCGERHSDGRPPFKLQMTWLLENRNFTKVVEGKYDDGRNPASGAFAARRPSPGGEVATRVIERGLAMRQRRAARGNS